MTESEVYVGINVAGGIAYLGVCRGKQLDLSDTAESIEPNRQLALAEQLEDFRARLGQEFRRLAPQEVGIARTRKFSQWQYKPAAARFGLEAVAMVAAIQEGVPCSMVVQEDAAKAAQVPVTKFAEAMPARFGIDPTHHWDKRALAFATALALAKGETR
jgi:hypothetical protein